MTPRLKFKLVLQLSMDTNRESEQVRLMDLGLEPPLFVSISTARISLVDLCKISIDTSL